MNTKSHEKTVCHQFDSLCKKTLKYRARDYYRKEQLNRIREISIESIPICELEELLIDQQSFKPDSGEMANHIDICGIEISIFDEALFAALSTLSGDQRRIVLLYYFWGYNDREIAEMTNTSRRTITYRRYKALTLLRNRIEADLDYG